MLGPDLAAFEELLDHDLGAGRAECALKHHGNGSFGFRQSLCHNDTLAGGKPIGLDHDWRALRADIGPRVGGATEAAIGAGRNIELAAQVLGKAFGALELRRRLARPKRLDADRREIVDDPGGKRRLRADHDEIHRVAPAEFGHRGVVGDIDRNAFRFAGDAGIARRAP